MTTSDWSGRRALVTGAAGFIGSHLVEHLAGLGADVVAFTRYTSHGRAGMLETLSEAARARVRNFRGDIRDAEAVSVAVKGVDCVFHLAALVGIPYSMLHPADVVGVNTLGTLNVLNASRAAGTGRVVIASTSEVYGTAQHVPIDERHPLHAQSPYAASKIAADALASSYHRCYDLPVAIARPFNTFGPRQSDRAVIPTIISQALYGEKVRLGNIHSTRDFTYVTDTVRGFVAAADAPDAVLGTAVNLGSGFEITVNELAERIISLCGGQQGIEVDEGRLRPRAGEVERLWCDNRLARELLGWSPAVSLEEGLVKTIRWVSEHTDLYQPTAYNI